MARGNFIEENKRVALRKMMKAQKDETDWNFYHERQHVENLFYSRFNFFLVLYGMIVAAAASLESAIAGLGKCEDLDFYLYVICGLLICGIVILVLVWFTLRRNCQTLDIILQIIDRLPPHHSSPILSEYMKANSKIPSSRTLMSVVIPLCCILSLVIYLVYIYKERLGLFDTGFCLPCKILCAIVLIVGLCYLFSTKNDTSMIKKAIKDFNDSSTTNTQNSQTCKCFLRKIVVRLKHVCFNGKCPCK